GGQVPRGVPRTEGRIVGAYLAVEVPRRKQSDRRRLLFVEYVRSLRAVRTRKVRYYDGGGGRVRVARRDRPHMGARNGMVRVDGAFILVDIRTARAREGYD